MYQHDVPLDPSLSDGFGASHLEKFRSLQERINAGDYAGVAQTFSSDFCVGKLPVFSDRLRVERLGSDKSEYSASNPCLVCPAKGFRSNTVPPCYSPVSLFLTEPKEVKDE